MFLASSVWSLLVLRPLRMSDRMARFSRGASDGNILMMIWIFILAGAFAAAAEYIGAVTAMVNLALSVMPSHMMLAGMFLTSCLISLSIGTSVGTIVALMPVAVGMAESTASPVSLMAGVVIGGAFFGDNLSFISDTTVAATRTQGCLMVEKFRVNVLLALPAAALTMGIYIILGWGDASVCSSAEVSWVRVLPYLLVLGVALSGVHVVQALVWGILATGVEVFLFSDCEAVNWLEAMGRGMFGMGELIIVTLLAGGMLELIRYNGGLGYIICCLGRHVRTRRQAELCIALMVAVANVCTANNTVAIVSVGAISRGFAQRFGISPARSASLLDTSSCIVQGMLPYGAQLLIGATLAGVSAMEMIPCLYYPMAMGVMVWLSILTGWGYCCMGKGGGKKGCFD